MNKFNYRLKTLSGEEINGIIDAQDKTTAINQLQKDGKFVVSLEPIIQETDDTENLRTSIFYPVTRKEVLLFTWQLATLQNTGSKLINSLEIISYELKNQLFKKKLIDISIKIKSGLSFSEALSSHNDVFDEVYVASIKAGEQSGKLNVILNKLAEKLEEEVNLSKKIKTSLIYPVILSITAFIGLLIILVFILPKFKEVFITVGKIIPAYTLFLFKLSDYIVNYSHFILSFIVIFFLVFIIAKPFKKRFYFIDVFKLRIPFIKNLYEKIFAVNFFSTLALLLSNGVNIIEALNISKTTVNNAVFEEIIQKIINNIQQGKKIKEVLLKEKNINSLYAYMLGLGEESGTLDETLDKLSKQLNLEIKFTLESLVTFIEPVLILCLGVIIVFIAISIFIPLTDLLTTIRR